MDTQQNGESRMTEAELIREVYPRHTLKLLARLMAVPGDTVRAWLYRGVAARRRAEIFQRLLDVYDQETRRRVEIRRQLEVLAHARRYERTDLGTGSTDGSARQLAEDIAPKR